MSKQYCTWKDGDSCKNVAIEKWTEIPFIDPYFGPFDGSIIPYVNYFCEFHSNLIKNIIFKECASDCNKALNILNTMYEIKSCLK